MFKDVRRSGRELRGGLYTKAVGKTTMVCATGVSSQTEVKPYKRVHPAGCTRGKVIRLTENGLFRVVNGEFEQC